MVAHADNDFGRAHGTLAHVTEGLKRKPGSRARARARWSRRAPGVAASTTRSRTPDRCARARPRTGTPSRPAPTPAAPGRAGGPVIPTHRVPGGQREVPLHGPARIEGVAPAPGEAVGDGDAGALRLEAHPLFDGERHGGPALRGEDGRER